MVKELCEHYDEGKPLTPYPWQMLDENKWLAARHGLDGQLVDLPSSDRVGTRDLARRLRRPPARRTPRTSGSAGDLDGIDDLLTRGTRRRPPGPRLRGEP